MAWPGVVDGGWRTAYAVAVVGWTAGCSFVRLGFQAHLCQVFAAVLWVTHTTEDADEGRDAHPQGTHAHSRVPAGNETGGRVTIFETPSCLLQPAYSCRFDHSANSTKPCPTPIHLPLPCTHRPMSWSGELNGPSTLQ